MIMTKCRCLQILLMCLNCCIENFLFFLFLMCRVIGCILMNVTSCMIHVSNIFFCIIFSQVMDLEYSCETCDLCPPNTITQQTPLNCSLKYGNGGNDACYFTDFGDARVEPRRFLVGDMSACQVHFPTEFNLGP